MNHTKPLRANYAALASLSCALFLGLPAEQVLAAPVASYYFNNSLAAEQAGVAALTATDPLGLNAFVADNVFGSSRQVYAFNGIAAPVLEQAGLSLDTTGLISANNYSVEMAFELTERDNAWRRIVDVEGRQSDNGFYVEPSNQLNVYPLITGGNIFSANTYHHVVLSDAAGSVSAYLDGILAFTVATTLMDINNPANAMNFFLDNIVASGQGEYSSGRVALIRLYEGALSAGQVADLAANPFGAAAVPEPSTLAILGLGMLGIGLSLRRSA